MSEEQKIKSKLVPVGIVLILLGMFLPKAISNITQLMDTSTLKSIMLISTDLFRLCFFIGVICAIIGGLRNRKMKKQLALEEKLKEEKNC